MLWYRFLVEYPKRAKHGRPTIIRIFNMLRARETKQMTLSYAYCVKQDELSSLMYAKSGTLIHLN
uniref:Putative ovule protein n=1 Tax=Solanum chacoense TaxID=4108 RepID=A0A0V0HF29_SOLCH